MNTYQEKTALITGGNRGIGLAIVEGLAAQGYRVLLGSRNLANGAQEATRMKGKVITVTLDLIDRKVLQDHMTTILAQFPDIDVLINNAALLEQGNVLDVSTEGFSTSMRVNVEGPFDLIRLLVPGMIERDYGRIVNLSSGWGSFAEGLSGPAAYSVSKAALNALSVKLAHSLPRTIKVNSMCPGWVRTRMGGQNAVRSPEEGAQTAIWLATLDQDGPTGKFFRDKQVIAW